MDKKKEEILKSAIELFSKYSIRSVSMDDICRELSISKKTLYKYYRSKNDLLNGILEQKSAEIDSIIEKAYTEQNNAIDKLMDITRKLGEYLGEIHKVPSIKFDMYKYYPELMQKFGEKRQKKVAEYLINNIKEGVQQGLFREGMDVEIVAMLFIKRMEEVSDPEMNKETGFSMKKVFKVMIENHIRGISNNKGIQYFEENYYKNS